MFTGHLYHQCDSVGYHVAPNKWHHRGGGELWWGCGDSDEQFLVCVQYTWDIQRYTLSGGHSYWSPTSHLLAISDNIYGIHLFRDQLTLVKLYRPWSCQLHKYSTHASCSTASSPQAATQPTRTLLFSCGKPDYRPGFMWRQSHAVTHHLPSKGSQFLEQGNRTPNTWELMNQFLVVQIFSAQKWTK